MHPHELPAETIERIFSRLGFEFVNAFERSAALDILILGVAALTREFLDNRNSVA